MIIDFDSVIYLRTEGGPLLGGFAFGFFIFQYLIPFIITYAIGYHKGKKDGEKKENGR